MYKITTFLLILSISIFLITFICYYKITRVSNNSLEKYYINLMSVNKAKKFIKKGDLEQIKINGYIIKLDNEKIVVKKED
ncbi:hypothetical protein OSSY52_20930 [Tepiditoga spiralis]|uniref:Uncharacterized protein n=1 Tax=Tepiditoga spiralis TaxID=2108365 RepID=A0A7G1GBT1_9BACT|nr:hypothetical protein [Tepiditoga spiralis]BBE31952.1 hypothetical protein OSSY52_20930 [Tepiditoga spiralis]